MPFLIKQGLFIPCSLSLKFKFIPVLKATGIVGCHKGRLNLAGLAVKLFYRYRFLFFFLFIIFLFLILVRSLFVTDPIKAFYFKQSCHMDFIFLLMHLLNKYLLINNCVKQRIVKESVLYQTWKGSNSRSVT